MPLKGCAEKLASKQNWSVLYDIDAIKRNKVRVRFGIGSEVGLGGLGRAGAVQ